MEQIVGPFIQNPALVALIGGLFFVAYLLLRGNPARRSSALLVPATAWLIWTVWEWAVLVFSPEADIRVDLLLIIPLSMNGLNHSYTVSTVHRLSSPACA